jgi:uncharacterized protein
MIDATPLELDTVRQILARHVPDCEVWAFGSRVTGTSRPHSDLDLVVMTSEPIPRRTLVRMEEDLEESPLPFRVDVLDWSRVSPEFRRIIRAGNVILQTPTATPHAV